MNGSHSTIKRIVEILLQDLSFFGGLAFTILTFVLLFSLGAFNLALWFAIGHLILLLLVSVARLLLPTIRPRLSSISDTSIFTRIDQSSFPSLHASRSTFTLLLLNSIVHNYVILFTGVFLIICVCFSRYYFKHHTLTDILFGVLLGGAIFYLTRLYFI